LDHPKSKSHYSKWYGEEEPEHIEEDHQSQESYDAYYDEEALVEEEEYDQEHF
jgi:hypothetical protein